MLLEFIRVVKSFTSDKGGMTVPSNGKMALPFPPDHIYPLPPHTPHTPHTVPSPLLPHKDTLTTLLLSALADSHASIRVITIATIAGLLDLDSFLDSKEVL